MVKIKKSIIRLHVRAIRVYASIWFYSWERTTLFGLSWIVITKKEEEKHNFLNWWAYTISNNFIDDGLYWKKKNQFHWWYLTFQDQTICNLYLLTTFWPSNMLSYYKSMLLIHCTNIYPMFQPEKEKKYIEPILKPLV